MSIITLPLDKNSNEIYKSDTIIMPENDNNDDWRGGGWEATVEDYFPDDPAGEFIIVAANSGEVFSVDPRRVEKKN